VIGALLILAAAASSLQDPAWTKEASDRLRPFRARIAALAEDLGEYGMGRSARACERAFAALGAADREAEPLARRVGKALEKAAATAKQPDAKKLQRTAAVAAALASDLVGAAAGMELAAARRLAETAVLLDAANAPARALLGHALGPGGRLGDAETVKEWQWRRDFLAAVQAARDLRLPLEDADPTDPQLLGLDGPPALALQYGPVRFEGRMPRAYLENRFQHTLRAAAVSSWLAGGALEPHVGEFTMIWTWAGAEYERYLRAALARGLLDEAELRAALGMSASSKACWHLMSPTRDAMVANSTDYDLSTFARMDHALAPGTSIAELKRIEVGAAPEVPPWMQLAHVYLAGMAFFGDGWLTQPQTEVEHPPAWTPREEDEVYWMHTGWPAIHVWALVVAERAALPGVDALREQSDWYAMKGIHLFQGVSMLEMLYARRGGAAIWAAAAQAASAGGSTSGVWNAASLRAFLGVEPAEFDAQWHAWLGARVDARQTHSVVQALTSGGAADPLAANALAAVRSLRARWDSRAFDEDAAASAGCREHARALAAAGVPATDWRATRRRDPADPAATAEGIWSAMQGVVLRPGAKASVEEIETLLAGSLLHRVLLQQPMLERIGAGSHDGVLALDLATWSGYWAERDLRWPLPGATGVPLRHAAGVPSVVAGAEAGDLGHPITIFRFPLEGDLPAQMELRDDKGAVVETRNFQPYEFLELDVFVRGVYAMVPLQPLKRGAQHTASFRFPDETITWSFQTEP
jgi:hypothetical protein